MTLVSNPWIEKVSLLALTIAAKKSISFEIIQAFNDYIKSSGGLDKLNTKKRLHYIFPHRFIRYNFLNLRTLISAILFSITSIFLGSSKTILTSLVSGRVNK